MEMTGEYRIPAPRQRVWEALNDPEILRQCVPGCETMEKVSDTEYTATVALRIGPVNARFSGRVTLSDIDAPNSYTISGEGQGGAAGFAKGGAKVTLTEEDGATLLRYSASGSIGGKLAQIGQRLVDAAANKLAEEFFGKFAEIVGGAAAPPAPAEMPAPVPWRGLKPLHWIIILIAVVAGLLILFGPR